MLWERFAPFVVGPPFYPFFGAKHASGSGGGVLLMSFFEIELGIITRTLWGGPSQVSDGKWLVSLAKSHYCA